MHSRGPNSGIIIIPILIIANILWVLPLLVHKNTLAQQEMPRDIQTELRITNLIFAEAVDEMIPMGQSTSFHYSVSRVYSWMVVENATPPATLKHTYYFKDQKIQEVDLQVKYPHMRLWSYKTFSEKIFVGKWKLEVSDEKGRILATGFFDITN